LAIARAITSASSHARRAADQAVEQHAAKRRKELDAAQRQNQIAVMKTSTSCQQLFMELLTRELSGRAFRIPAAEANLLAAGARFDWNGLSKAQWRNVMLVSRVVLAEAVMSITTCSLTGAQVQQLRRMSNWPRPIKLLARLLTGAAVATAPGKVTELLTDWTINRVSFNLQSLNAAYSVNVSRAP
jgi:hypothetical protein